MKRIFVLALAVLSAVVGCVVWTVLQDGGERMPPAVEAENAEEGRAREKSPAGEGGESAMPSEPAKIEEPRADAEESETDGDSEEEPQTEEEKREAEEERLVDAFDALTDRWMEPSTNGVSVADVGKFAEQFKALPKDRQEECLHRALNLVPDENVMLLAGILMDKTVEKELVELVFNDVLNRDETVKKPILREIYKDKTHPCWADAAWIFDVTGEKGKSNERKQTNDE